MCAQPSSNRKITCPDTELSTLLGAGWTHNGDWPPVGNARADLEMVVVALLERSNPQLAHLPRGAEGAHSLATVERQVIQARQYT